MTQNSIWRVVMFFIIDSVISPFFVLLSWKVRSSILSFTSTLICIFSFETCCSTGLYEPKSGEHLPYYQVKPLRGGEGREKSPEINREDGDTSQQQPTNRSFTSFFNSTQIWGWKPVVKLATSAFPLGSVCVGIARWRLIPSRPLLSFRTNKKSSVPIDWYSFFFPWATRARRKCNEWCPWAWRLFIVNPHR